MLISDWQIMYTTLYFYRTSTMMVPFLVQAIYVVGIGGR